MSTCFLLFLPVFLCDQANKTLMCRFQKNHKTGQKITYSPITSSVHFNKLFYGVAGDDVSYNEGLGHFC